MVGRALKGKDNPRKLVVGRALKGNHKLRKVAIDNASNCAREKKHEKDNRHSRTQVKDKCNKEA